MLCKACGKHPLPPTHSEYQLSPFGVAHMHMCPGLTSFFGQPMWELVYRGHSEFCSKVWNYSLFVLEIFFFYFIDRVDAMNCSHRFSIINLCAPRINPLYADILPDSICYCLMPNFHKSSWELLVYSCVSLRDRFRLWFWGVTGHLRWAAVFHLSLWFGRV